MKKKQRIGILTSGGDCPGLNAAIRGVVKASYNLFEPEIIGIADGYKGLIDGDWKEMKESDFKGILTKGGTMLGTVRRPFRTITVIEEDGVDKVANMKKNYKKMGLDCLVTLGGNGTHKTANLLSQEGLNVIGLPKTIDNDIWGTDVTFGFHTAVDLGTDVVDRIHTTADSHGRVMVIEIMGNKAGWLTLYSGLGGGADVILLPEIPYDPNEVIKAVQKRMNSGNKFAIVVVAEGAFSQEEAKMKRRERLAIRAEKNYPSVGYQVAAEIVAATGYDTRVVNPGHYLRGGSPSAYDRVLSTQFGTYAANLIYQENYGQTVAMINGTIGHNALVDVAGKTKFVDPYGSEVQSGLDLGVSFGVKKIK